MRNEINEIIFNMKNADRLNYEYSEFKNEYLEKWINELCKIENNDNFLEILLEMVKEYNWISLIINIAWILRKYEPVLSKKLYLKLINTDVMSGFILKYWDEDQKELEKNRTKEDLRKIEKYENWKKDNFEKYKKIIWELEELIVK